MRLLLLATMENYLDKAIPAIQETLKDAKTILYIPYAKPNGSDYDQVKFVLQHLDKHVISANSANPVELLTKADAVFIGPGNIFRLLKVLNDTQLKLAIAKRINAGMPCISCGSSAHIFSPTIQTTNDMPISVTYSFQAMAVLPFQMFLFIKEFTLNDLKKIREFHEINSRPVLCLSTDSVLKYVHGHLYLEEVGCAALLRKGFRPLTLDAGKLDTSIFFESPQVMGDFFSQTNKALPHNDEHRRANTRTSSKNTEI